MTDDREVSSHVHKVNWYDFTVKTALAVAVLASLLTYTGHVASWVGLSAAVMFIASLIPIMRGTR